VTGQGEFLSARVHVEHRRYWHLRRDGKSRLEAFSDGVIAIIITIMVLKLPHCAAFDALLPVLPVLGSHVLSFIYVGIYWNNDHHLMHVVNEVRGRGVVGQLAFAVTVQPL